MRKQLFLGVVAALGLCSSSAWATRTNYKAHIIGDVSGSAGMGDATFTYDDTTKVFCGKVFYSGLTGTPQEFEIQVSGSTAVSLAKLPTSLASPFVFSKVLTTDQAAVTDLGNGPFVNLLTSSFSTSGEGELNGELASNDPGPDACPVSDAGADAGKDASTSTGTTSSSSSSSSGTDTSGSSSTPDAGTSPSSDGGGCSTVGDSNAASGIGLATIASMGVALILRGRRRRK